MALDAQELAHKLHEALSQKVDGHGVPTPVSDQTMNYAAGVVAALKAAIVTNAPGTINGLTAPGAPLSGGTGIGGLMVIQPGPMLAKTALGVPPQAVPNIAKENTAVIAYIGTGLITFAAGGITGNCTNTPVSPGPLAAGAGSGGKITLLTGAGATAAVIGAVGFSGPDMIKHYSALIDYISEKAEVSYASGSVTGICPAAGGPLSGAAGVGGTIT